MSVQAYVDEQLMGDIEGNHLTAAAIIGHDGTVWAQSPSFPSVCSLSTISNLFNSFFSFHYNTIDHVCVKTGCCILWIGFCIQSLYQLIET